MMPTLIQGRQSAYRESDLYWSGYGDYFLSEQGDVEKTNNYPQRLLVQGIWKIISSSQGEWYLQPTVGADLNKYVGMPNTQKTAELIKASIMSGLTRNGFLKPSNVQVFAFPVSEHGLMIAIVARQLDSSQPVVVKFTYNMRDNQTVPRNL